MVRHRWSDEEWGLIQDVFPVPATTGRRPRTNWRTVVDGILWIMHYRCPVARPPSNQRTPVVWTGVRR